MKVGLISLGCPKNLVDSEVMLGLAHEAGHELTTDAAGADVIVVNTCAFIDSAKQESMDAILEMAGHKKNGSCQRLIVTGCLAERYRDALRPKSPRLTRSWARGSPGDRRAIGGTAHALHVLLNCIPPRSLEPPGPSPETPSPGPEPPSYIYDAETPRCWRRPGTTRT